MIKPEAWKAYLEKNRLDPSKPNPGARVVIARPRNQPFEFSVMLDFQTYWWHEDDVEVIDQ